MLRPPYIWRQTADSPLSLLDFGAVADGVIYTDGSTNYLTATNNSPALSALLNAVIATKRKGVIPPGNFVYRTPFQVPYASGLRIEGAHEDSNLIYVNPLNQSGITIGSGTSGVNWVTADNSPITLAAASSAGSLTLTLATSAPGETPTQRLAKDMQLYIADPTQPIPYRAVAFNPAVLGSISFYRGSFVRVQRVIDATTIELGGITEWDFEVGAKVAYWNNPNRNVVIENLRFTYDLTNSFQGGAGSAIVLAGCINARMYDIRAYHATSRAFAWRNCIGLDVDTLIGEATVSGQGSLSTATGSGLCMIRNLYTEGGTHGIDFGGGEYTPSLHCVVDGVRARGYGGGVIGSHKAAGFLKFTNIDVVTTNTAWNTDDNPETDEFDRDTAITLRGPYSDVSNARVARAGIAFRSHKSQNHRWINCVSENCGRGMYIDDTDEVTATGVRHIDPVWWGTHLNYVTGPAQNLTLIGNQKFDDVAVTGTPGTQGDVLLYCAGQYDIEERCRDGGWEFTRFRQNSRPALVIGQGTAVNKAEYFFTSPTTNPADALIGPAYSMTTQTGATASTVNSTAAVVTSYRGREVLEVPGGTLAAGGRATQIRVESLEIASIEIDSPGELHAPGDVITLDGGSPTTRAAVTVSTVDGSGRILTFALTNKGDYQTAPSAFGQYSTTGSGKNVYLTSVSILSVGRRHAVGDIITAASGTPVRIAGVAQWPTIQVDAVDSLGGITACTLVFAGEFVALSPSLVLDQRETTGIGTSSRFTITGYVSRNATFKNALLVPKTASIYRAGKYTATPANPVTPTSVNGSGALATFDITYGVIVDVGQSPKMAVSITGGGASIVGLGPRRGIERRLEFTGAQTLVHSANFFLPNAATNILTAAGDACVARSDQSVPVVWKVVSYQRADGTALK